MTNLWHDTDGFPQTNDVHLAYVLIVDKNAARLRLKEPIEQTNNGRLAADKSNIHISICISQSKVIMFRLRQQIFDLNNSGLFASVCVLENKH